MKTTKPISTISFNSENFLVGTLETLRKNHKISFWAYILHKPEDDEGGKKYHFHVYIEPAVSVQTDDIRGCFAEFDPMKPEKPRQCLKFQRSKFDDWYLYILHDEAYLASKGQSRRFHYFDDEIIASDFDDLTFMIKSVDRLQVSRYADMLSAIKRGVTFDEYVSRGTIPIPQFLAFEHAWSSLAKAQYFSGSTYRDGRDGHLNDSPDPVSVSGVDDDGDLPF